MKNKYLLPLIIISLTIISCGKSQEEILIADYEQTTENAKMDLNFKLKNLEKVRDITGQDSLEILKPEFEEKKRKN